MDGERKILEKEHIIHRPKKAAPVRVDDFSAVSPEVFERILNKVSNEALMQARDTGDPVNISNIRKLIKWVRDVYDAAGSPQTAIDIFEAILLHRGVTLTELADRLSVLSNDNGLFIPLFEQKPAQASGLIRGKENRENPLNADTGSCRIETSAQRSRSGEPTVCGCQWTGDGSCLDTCCSSPRTETSIGFIREESSGR